MAPKNSIGAFAYRVQIRRKRRFTPYNFHQNDNGRKLIDCFARFCGELKDPRDLEDTNRRWYVDAFTELDDGVESFVQYGRTGFTSVLRDVKTKVTKYERERSDLELIPLFNRFWLPKRGNAGIWVFQSFSGYSCNNLMMQSFQDYFRRDFGKSMLSFSPIVASEFKKFREAPVRSVLLKSKSGGSDFADRQLGRSAEDVGLSVEMTAPPKENFGFFSEMSARFTGKSKEKAMTVSGIPFDEAYAKVKINGRTRTVAMTGVSSRTGLIDLSDDVVAGPNGHPKPHSIRKEFEDIIADVGLDMDL